MEQENQIPYSTEGGRRLNDYVKIEAKVNYMSHPLENKILVHMIRFSLKTGSEANHCCFQIHQPQVYTHSNVTTVPNSILAKQVDP